MKKLKKQRGSASIEATVSLTAFIFVIMAIYAIVNFCIVQSKMATAIDTTAKEISQYSYFYHALGLQGLDAKLKENKKQAVDTYEGISSLIDNPDSDITSLDGDTSTDLTTALADSDKTAVEDQYGKIKNAQSQISGVINNPAQFMKSIAALAGSAAFDEFKAHLIAAPIAKGLTQRHFGKTSAEANEYLKNYGVVGGYDGVNFNMSTMLMQGKPNDVEIVVYYNLDLSTIFPIDLKITMCQRASTRAWLGGDLDQPKEETTK